MKTVWFCEVCRQIGAVEHDDHADVMTVINSIYDAHGVGMVTDPPQLNAAIRVVNPEADWRSSVPHWARQKLEKLL